MAVRLVVTEYPGALTAERRAHYERIRGRLERAAGAEVQSVLYTHVEDLGGAPAVVLSGSFAPWAVHDPDALARLGAAVTAYDGPVLGICGGMQLQATFAGGAVGRAQVSPEAGYRSIDVLDDRDLLSGLPPRVLVYQHHTDEITALPQGFEVLATSRECGIEAIADRERRWWGTQFHPEEFSGEHPAGERVLRNFFALARPG